MEHLAQTCKILYDKDILDKMNKLDKQKYHPICKFDTLFSYFNRVKRFESNIRASIVELILTDNIYEELCNNLNWISDEILFIKFFKPILIREILNVTNQKYKKWCKHITTTTICSIKGTLKSLAVVSNESYSKKHLVDAITCVIFGIFCTQDEENCGLFEKISYIKCDICKKLSNKVILDDKVICEKCILTQ